MNTYSGYKAQFLLWGVSTIFLYPKPEKNVDKYKNVVASYIKVVDEYKFRLQSSISFYGV